MLKRLFVLSCLAAATAGAQNVIQLPDSLYAPGDTVVWVKRLAYYCEGPAWNPATGDVTFSQIGDPGTPANRPDWLIWRIKPGHDTGSVYYNKGQSNGQMLDPSGRLAVVQRATVIRFGAKIDTLALSGSNGVSFDANGNNTDVGSGNDLSFASNGAFYFTNLASGIFYVSPAGQLSQVYSAAQSTNGIDWIEEEHKLYVHEGKTVWRYDVQTDGSLANRTTFVTQSGMGADGGCVDSHGNQWVADYNNGILRVFNTIGQAIGTITMRSVPTAYNIRAGNAGNVDNCAFGGPDLKTLYLTGDGGLYSLAVKIPGRPDPRGATALRPLRPGRGGDPAAATERRDARGRKLKATTHAPALKKAGRAPGSRPQG